MTEVRAKKALGQHFLTDLNIARKIADALSGVSAEATRGTSAAMGKAAAATQSWRRVTVIPRSAFLQK